MAPYFVLCLFVFLGCVSDSYQRCFSYHCHHHAPLSECVQGSWQCQHGEFCELTTHQSHGNNPWVVMNCRPHHQISDCQATQANNDPNCDPNQHQLICNWCCEDAACMHSLTNGTFPTASAATTAAADTTIPDDTTGPDNTTAATTSAGIATDTTVQAASATAAAASDTPAMSMADTTTMMDSTVPPTTAPPTTTPTPVTSTEVCQDLYVRDCSMDFAGRCSEPLVAQLCAVTCGNCP